MQKKEAFSVYYTTTYPSPLGVLTLGSDGAALTGLWLAGQKYFGAGLPDAPAQRPDLPVFAKARAWLDSHGLDYTLRDIKEDRPTREELALWHSRSGLPLRKFFNTSGLLYKSLSLKDRLPGMTEDEQLDLLATDGMLVKRPILVTETAVLVGFREADWAAALL